MHVQHSHHRHRPRQIELNVVPQANQHRCPGGSCPNFFDLSQVYWVRQWIVRAVLTTHHCRITALMLESPPAPCKSHPGMCPVAQEMPASRGNPPYLGLIVSSTATNARFITAYPCALGCSSSLKYSGCPYIGV